MRPLIIAAFLVACSAKTEPTPDATADVGETPACRVYAGTPSDGFLSVDGTGGDHTLPKCAPRCGAPMVKDGFPSASALPTGSCSGEPTCDIAAVPQCPCGGGPVNAYRCACESGTWRCWIVAQGGAACGLCDAGTDTEEPTCLVDFPCNGIEWDCTDETHAKMKETHDCHYRCGAAKCGGATCDPTGPTVACEAGMHCTTRTYDGGIPVPPSPCQPDVEAGTD